MTRRDQHQHASAPKRARWCLGMACRIRVKRSERIAPRKKQQKPPGSDPRAVAVVFRVEQLVELVVVLRLRRRHLVDVLRRDHRQELHRHRLARVHQTRIRRVRPNGFGARHGKQLANAVLKHGTGLNDNLARSNERLNRKPITTKLIDLQFYRPLDAINRDLRRKAGQFSQ